VISGPVPGHIGIDRAAGTFNARSRIVIATGGVPVPRPDATTLGMTGLPDDPMTAALTELAGKAGTVWIGGPEMSEEEAQRYDAGYAQQTIWPLYHDLIWPSVYDEEWRTAYHSVNVRFARAIAGRADDGASVFVCDYRLQLVPGLLRLLRPDLRIGFYLPIPFPSPDLFRCLPGYAQLRLGLLGADFIGFATEQAAGNFQRLWDASPSFGPSRGAGNIGVYPCSVETARIRALAARSEVQERASALRASLGDTGAVVLSIDTVDQAHGVERRLRALGELFATGSVTSRDATVVQVLVQSDSLPVRSDAVDAVARQVARINGDAGGIGRPCVHFLLTEPNLEHRVALYLAADIMMATPLRQAAHHPALEYVTANPGRGLLVLSEFTGTATTLPEALIVNPYDDDDIRQALSAALTMGREERYGRMRAMHDRVAASDHQAWLHALVNDLHARFRMDVALRDRQRRRTHLTRPHGRRDPVRRPDGRDLR
jgi:trehalose 6-phosphate synthase